MTSRVVAGDPALRGLGVRSLTTEFAPWQVERDALLLSDGSYVIGFECQPLATDGMSDDDLSLLARRAQAWLHARPKEKTSASCTRSPPIPAAPFAIT